MGLKLDQIIPWGRSLTEYVHMFDLTPTDLQNNILDCAGGPASFNAEMTRDGYSVTSLDPIYQFRADEIANRIQASYHQVIEGVKASLDAYVWTAIQTPEQLGQIRMSAMQHFLRDFPVGLQTGRYRVGELPTLPFQTGQFGLALCSHLLFTYSDHLSLDFHTEAIAEMLRVALEVRIFPLLKISGEASPFLQPVITALEARGYCVEIRQVPYEFQQGGNQMLQVLQSVNELRHIAK